MVASIGRVLVHAAIASICHGKPALPAVALQGIGEDLPTEKVQGKRDARLTLLTLGSGEPINDFLWPAPSKDMNCTVKIHGHSSSHFAKKSYTLKLKDASGHKLKTGFGHRWRDGDGFDIVGPYADRSLIRNALVYSLANDMGVWAPRGVFVELYHKQGDALIHQGVYMIVELLEPERLQLRRGDLLIQYDWPDADPGLRHAWQSGPSAFMLKYPEDEAGPGEPNQTALPQYYVPPSGTKTYEMAQLVNESMGIEVQPDLSSVNIDSLVDFFLLTELSGNVDAYRFSTYFHAKRGELFAGPVWDEDLALGNSDENTDNYGLGHWQYMWAAQRESLVAKFLEKLVDMSSGSHKSDFAKTCSKRWAHLRDNVLSDAALDARVLEYVHLLNKSGAVARNFEVWGPIEGPLRVEDCLNPLMGRTDAGRTYDSEIQFLRDWLHQRVRFIDADVGVFESVLPPEEVPAPEEVPLDPDSLIPRLELGAAALGVLVVLTLVCPVLRGKLGGVGYSTTEPLLQSEELARA